MPEENLLPEGLPEENLEGGFSQCLTTPEGVVRVHMEPSRGDCCTSHHLRLFNCLTFFLGFVPVAIFAILLFSFLLFSFFAIFVHATSPNFSSSSSPCVLTNERPGFAGPASGPCVLTNERPGFAGRAKLACHWSEPLGEGR